MIARLPVTEELRIRGLGNYHVAPVQPSSAAPAWMRSTGFNRPGPLVTGVCELTSYGWNGKGWFFYCGCGYFTPLRRGFSEGIDLLETHWLGKRAQPSGVGN